MLVFGITFSATFAFTMGLLMQGLHPVAILGFGVSLGLAFLLLAMIADKVMRQ